MVHFTPGARTAWHTHPFGQTIFVTEGIGRCQRRGGPIEEIRPGDRVFFEPGEDHWHGAAPDRFMAHLAIQEADDSGSPVTWGAHVTDAEYTARLSHAGRGEALAPGRAVIPHTVAVPDGSGSLSGDQEHDDAEEKHEHDRHTGGEQRAVGLWVIAMSSIGFRHVPPWCRARDPMIRLAT